MEEVFDSKIQQINFLTEDNIKDKIEEAVAEIEIKPELFDDIYAKIDHSHTSFNNDLTVNGKINAANFITNNGIMEIGAGTNYNGYVVFQTKHDVGGTIYFRQFDTKGNQRSNLTLLDNNGNTEIPGNLTVGGLKIVPNSSSKNIVSFYINGYKYWHCDNNSDMFTIYKNLNVDMNLTVAQNVNISTTSSLRFGTSTETKALINYFEKTSEPSFLAVGCDNYRLKIHNNGDVMVQGNLTVSGNANIYGDLNTKAINSSSLQVKGTSSFTDEVDIQDSLIVDKDLVVFGAASLENATITGKLTVNGKVFTGNETITHKTDEIQGEIGTFCETNGGIYTGYNEITETDCICQVQQSNTLNSKIVGIITDKDRFASHGDVLVKIVPGTYHLGDILCPDITGKARIATETELQYMMLHAIPRAKITSLDTKIEGTVAAFLF